MRSKALLGLLLLTGCADKAAPASDAGRSSGANEANHDGQGDGGAAAPTSAEDVDTMGTDASRLQTNAQAGEAGPPATRDASSASSSTGGDASSAVHDAGSASGVPSDGGTDALGPTPSASASYRAERYIGGLDHVTIFKRDEVRGFCVLVRLAFPAPASNSEVQVPAQWRLEGISAIDAVSCDLPVSTQNPPATRTSLSAKGRIAWRKLGPESQPCSVDVDLTLTFESVGHIPSADRLLVEDLAVPCS